MRTYCPCHICWTGPGLKINKENRSISHISWSTTFRSEFFSYGKQISVEKMGEGLIQEIRAKKQLNPKFFSKHLYNSILSPFCNTKTAFSQFYPIFKAWKADKLETIFPLITKSYSKFFMPYYYYLPFRILGMILWWWDEKDIGVSYFFNLYYSLKV